MRQLASSLPDMDGSGYGNMKQQYEELAGRYVLNVECRYCYFMAIIIYLYLVNGGGVVPGR